MSVTCWMDYTERDNGVLSSDARHCTPLECEMWEISISERSFIANQGAKNQCFLLNELFRKGQWHAMDKPSGQEDLYRTHYPFA